MVIDVDDSARSTISTGCRSATGAFGGGPAPGAGFTSRRYAGSPGRRHVRAIVLAEPGSMDAPARIDALRAVLASPISFGEREITLSVSIGAAHYNPKLHDKGGDLLADAQLALANAKKAGGDRVEIFAPNMRLHRTDRQTLGNDVRRALERGEISILFRPIVRLADRTVAESSPSSAGVIRGLESSATMSSSKPPSRPAQSSTSAPTPQVDREGARCMAEGARSQSTDLRDGRSLLTPNAQPRPLARRALRARPPLRPARLAQACRGREPVMENRKRRGSPAAGA